MQSLNYFWYHEISKDIIQLNDVLNKWLNSEYTFINKIPKNLLPIEKEDDGFYIHTSAIVEIANRRDDMYGYYEELTGLSVFKKAAILVDAILGLKPFKYKGKMSSIAARYVLATNVRCAWDIGLSYIYRTEIMGDDGEVHLVEKIPVFHSKHYKAEVLEQHLLHKLTVPSISLLLESLTYKENPSIAGCRDASTCDGKCDPFLVD